MNGGRDATFPPHTRFIVLVPIAASRLDGQNLLMTKDKDTKPGDAFAARVRKAVERPASAPPAPPHEGRLERQPVFANATLVLSSGKIAAVVTNVNALGARVEFTVNTTLQGEIGIVAPTLGINSRARVAWQRGRNAGLVFVKQV